MTVPLMSERELLSVIVLWLMSQMFQGLGLMTLDYLYPELNVGLSSPNRLSPI